jgi:hypothetical protein
MSDLKTAERAKDAEPRTVEGVVNYSGELVERPRYYANDHSRDVLNLEGHTIEITDARGAANPPSIEREGFQLVPHKSAVANFRDSEETSRVHPAEIERLLLELTGADRVVVTGAAGVLRFGESSPDAGRFNNSYPARFIHIDASTATSASNAERTKPRDEGRKVRRYAHYNVWRVLSPPPQDIPLTVCDARTLTADDLIEADAIFDSPGQPEWGFEGWLVRYSPRHRWSYFSNMTRDEALVFKTSDSHPSQPRNVPHVAFDDPSCPKGVPTRSSIEMRAVAYWFE